jgi:hypothetical protein
VKIPEGLERYAKGTIHSDLKLVGIKSVQDKMNMRLDLEVEHPDGERFWLEDAPLVEAYNNNNGSLYILQERNIRVALVGVSI